MATSKPIDPIGMGKLSEIVGHQFDQLMILFLEEIPKQSSNSFGGKVGEDFFKEIMKKTIAEIPVALTSIIPLMLSQPTKFYWELVKHLLIASAKVKREIAGRYSGEKYDVENDITETKKQLENVLASQFKTEVALWKLMDEKRWEEAFTIVKAIEIERENSDLQKRVEAANWKQQIAYNLGDADTFFESISSVLKIAGDNVSYSPNDMVYGISMLLPKVLIGINLAFTPLGKHMISTQGFMFAAQQGQMFQEYLIGKIIEATFKNRIISSGNDFRNFIADTKKDTVEIFKKLNPYVEEIMY